LQPILLHDSPIFAIWYRIWETTFKTYLKRLNTVVKIIADVH